MNALILVSIGLFVAALICRHYAGGHLTPPSHRMKTIEPTYWLSKQQRERQEFYAALAAPVCGFALHRC